MAVAVMHWPPAEGERKAGEATLLLVAADAPPPPTSSDPLEDWVRLPASPGDIDARIKRLALLAEQLQPREPEGPVMEPNGVLRFGGQWIALAETPARLAAVLTSAFGKVVTRRMLFEAAWPDQPVPANTLEVAVSRLRRQLLPLGLEVKTLRRRGYLLQPR